MGIGEVQGVGEEWRTATACGASQDAAVLPHPGEPSGELSAHVARGMLVKCKTLPKGSHAAQGALLLAVC
jgi:hypothetical protein